MIIRPDGIEHGGKGVWIQATERSLMNCAQVLESGLFGLLGDLVNLRKKMKREKKVHVSAAGHSGELNDGLGNSPRHLRSQPHTKSCF